MSASNPTHFEQFTGTIRGQDFYSRGEAVILTVGVPEAGQEIPVKVWLNYDQTKLPKTLQVLQSLGFDDYDISRLHPEHENFFDLSGKEIRLYATVKDGKARFYVSTKAQASVSLADLKSFVRDNKDIMVETYKASKEVCPI